MYPNTEPFLKESKLHGIFKNISRVFCIFDNPKNKHKCVIYYMFFWVVSGILQIYAIWNRLFINKLHSVHSVTIIEMFFRVQIVLTNFLATWDLLFFKMDKIDKLNRVTELFKNSTKLHKEIAHSKRRFLILSVLILVSTTSAGLFNFIENIRSLGILIVIDFGPPVVLIIQTALLVTNICCKLHDIGMCLRILNREMCNTMMYSYTWIVIGNNHAKRQEFFGFLRAYNELFDTLVLANDVYSFHFLMLLLNVTTIILHISNMFIKYASGVLTINNGDVWKLTSIFSCIVLYVVFGLLLTYTCHEVVKQTKDTIGITYKLLINLQDFRTQEEQYIKEYLMIFTEQIHGRDFHFTASGLFTVDLTALFMILGSIAMYLIIIPIDF